MLVYFNWMMRVSSGSGAAGSLVVSLEIPVFGSANICKLYAPNNAWSACPAVVFSQRMEMGGFAAGLPVASVWPYGTRGSRI
jgi:hypothetical protein